MKLFSKAALLLCLVCLPAPAAEFGAIASETGIALVGNILGVGAWLGGVFLVSMNDSVEFGQTSWPAVAVTVAAIPAVPAFAAGGAVLGGRLAWQDGRFLPSYLGSLAGTSVGAGLFLAGQAVSQDGVSAGLSIAGLLMPAVGGVVGFNVGKPEQIYGCGSLPERLRNPGFTVGYERCSDGHPVAKLGARLISIAI